MSTLVLISNYSFPESSAPHLTNIKAGTDQISLTWSPPETANGVITQYNIQYGDEDNTDSYTSNVAGDVTNVTLTDGIGACIYYVVHMAAVNGAGTGDVTAGNATTLYQGIHYIIQYL